MKYATKLYIADVPQAQTHAWDVEADTPEQAAENAHEHWQQHWIGPSPTTETVIHVHRMGEDGRIDPQVLFNMVVQLESFDPNALDRKRMALALRQSLTPESRLCPFCGGVTKSKDLGDSCAIECGSCKVRFEISKTAMATRCENPASVLDYIRKQMEHTQFPKINSMDLHR